MINMIMCFIALAGITYVCVKCYKLIMENEELKQKLKEKIDDGSIR